MTIIQATKFITTSPWRQPWANTIAYYPLNWDLLDHSLSWTHNAVIDSWTPTWVTVQDRQVINLAWKYLTTWGLTTSIFNSPFTLCFYTKFNSTPWSLVWMMWDVNGASWWNINIQFESIQWWMQWYVQKTSSTYRRNAFSCSPWTNWHLMCFTGSWTADPLFYLDWNEITATISWSTFQQLTSYNFVIWAAYGTASDRKNNNCFSEIILEDKVWTAQEISDYYNQTKSLYGIS